MTRRSLLASVALAILAAAALLWAFAPRPLLVDVVQVRRAAFVQTIDEDGVTRVRERYVIAAPVAGMLLRPGVRAGDTVQRDQLLVTIIPNVPQILDPRTRAELLARVAAADARLARARALVRQSEAGLRQAELDARRLADLAEEGFVAQTQREQAQLALDVRRRDLEAARFEADAASHELEQARAAVGRSDDAQRRPGNATAAWEIRSPVDGQVLSVAQESGGPVALGSTILDLGDVRRLEAVIDVLSIEATQIAPQAYVTLQAGEGVTLAGRVRTIEPSAKTRISALGVEEQRVNVIVELLPNPTREGVVGDGYRVEARIEIARLDDAVLVPVAALFREDRDWAVFTVSDGRAHRRAVRIGARNGDDAVVVVGLSPGEVVIVYPSDALGDGRRVQARG